jgi:hypothetical protein
LLTELSATQIEWLNCVKDGVHTPENGWWVMLSRCLSKFLFLVLGFEYHAHFYFSDSDK